MKIAIVDDELKEREILQGYVSRFAEEAGLLLETVLYDSGARLLESYQKDFDIIIFDIDMPGISGMDTARKIRETDQKVTIIFVTNFAQYAINGYEVDAVDYIIKPIGYYEFSMKFYRTVAKASQKKDHYIQIETGEEIRNVRVSAISYIEVLGHYIYYHTKSGVYKIRGTMAEVESQFRTYHFIRVHRSYLVNLDHVERIVGKEVVVEGQNVPVGNSYKDSLRQAYLKFARGEIL